VSPKELAALFLLGALWGASFPFIRVAVPEFGPFALVAARVTLAAVVLAAYVWMSGGALKVRPWWRQFLLLGTMSVALPFTLISAAEVNITASLAAILNSTTVFFTAIIASLWLGDPLTGRKLLGIVAGISGVGILVGWDPQPLNGIVLLSVFAVLGASLAYGISGVYAKKTFSGLPPASMAVGQLSMAAVVMLPVTALRPPVEAPSALATFCLLGLALLSTSVAYLLFFYLLENAGPTSTSSVTLIVPVFGLLLSVLFLDEPVGVGTLVGLLTVLVSVALVTGARLPSKSKSYPEQP
jgi:drug/metabolite transporter (DMT)-like permease